MPILDILKKRKQKDPEEIARTKISEIMKTDLVTISEDTSLARSINAMRREGVNYLLVTEGEKLVGVVTDGDILYSIYEKKVNPEKTPVGKIMTKNVTTISPKQTVKKALELIISKKIRRLPVIEKGKLVGLVSLTDIEDYAGYLIILKV